ncbi:MAG TPA: hypothetical protein VJ763_05310 [Sphingomicrobium sp.]|nr:hypothetical protein [Sphingomicrobium sp.]
MAIRRFREHAAAQNWFAVGVDLAIVVVGVFLGIQASNWNAARIERAEARAYRTLIIEDLKANEQELAERSRYYRQVRAHAIAAMAALEGPTPRGEAFLVNSYQATQVSPLWMERSAYDEMIASGMAKSFGEPAVRRRLSSYYAATARLEAASIFDTGYRERIRRDMMFAVQRRLRERCSDLISISEGRETITLPERCSLQLPATLISRAANDLSKIPELEEELTRHIGDLDVKIARFDRWLQLARGTRQALEEVEMS